METLLLRSHHRCSLCVLSPPRLPSFRSSPTRSNDSVRFAFGRRMWSRKVSTFCSMAAFSNPASSSYYGGWDDPGLDDGVQILGKPEMPHDVFVSMGIADLKYAFLFCLGFLSAWAISRVRIWTLAALPFCGFVFASGVLVGVARGSVAGEWLTQIRRKQDNGSLPCEKMKAFGELLDDLGVKLSELESSLRRFVDLNYVESGEIKRCIGILNSVSLVTLPLKKFVQDSTGSDFSGGQVGEERELETKSSPKSSKKRKEAAVAGADILQSLVAMFQEVLIGSDTHKAKDSGGERKEALEKLNPTDPGFQTGVGKVDEPINNREVVKVDPLSKGSFDGRPALLEMSSETIKRNSTEAVKGDGSDVETGNTTSSADATENGNGSSNSRDDSHYREMVSDKEDLHILNRDFHLTSMQGSYHKVVFQHKSHKTEIGRKQSRIHDYAETGLNSRIQENEMVSFTEAKASLNSRKTAEVYDKTYLPTNDKINKKVKAERETQAVGFREKVKKLEAQSLLDDQHSKHDIETNNKPSSSSSSSSVVAATSPEEEFNHLVNNGVNLLRQAGECLKVENDEKTAELLLYKSTRFLSMAVSMKPRNQQALGQLGNACLLHGELKLKISHDLRALLSRNDPAWIGKRSRSQTGEQSNRFLNKEKAASMLVDVCEECEGLLIDAGRNYKMVLSIDGNDVRALYNWGLALSFRAQLIADVGPDAAFDADKVYLAAIEKFDAMLSRSNDYAPDALFRWGIALRQRSHLRSQDSSEKVKLLQQAKSLFEDVLRVDSGNPHVRDALHSCITELNTGRRLRY